MSKLTHEQIAELVVEAQQGSEKAFAMLYTATAQQQLKFASAFLKDSVLAEDVVQNVYLSMFRALPNLKNPKVFVAYLNRICYNTCVDFKKKYFRQKNELNEEALLRVPDEKRTEPEESYEFSITSKHLYGAISTLEEQQREAFLLRHYFGLKIQEIADFMGISESTVKRSIKSAIKTLSNILDEKEVVAHETTEKVEYSTRRKQSPRNK